ncbi:papilin isoform X5 [Aedes aegypti]|uniref:Uncharacterized protein n=1 Tax=Aedes aegypti TaxID=7159 RepID=A0A6I8TTF2_AEDAE|nr:papilin isoform X5 [Aedes aegypti]
MRYLQIVVFIVVYHISLSQSRRFGFRRHKRQYGSNLYLPESYIIPGGDDSPDDQWGPWSSPSECSRSCGGGVAHQTRECLNTSPDGQPLCRGGSRKYFSCNIQDCPEGELDFRKQQCSEFNSVPFENHRYQWVPYTKAPNPCELNCMPIGERFYYRHKAKVTDGTRCNDESFDVCVDGTCQAVGCDMMLGSNAKEDKCRTCQGDGSGCKTVTGLLDANNLQVGYNDLLLIPSGATNVAISERGPSNNYLAIRNLTGFYHLNGNYRIDFPRAIHFAGSDWHYERRPQGFAAPDKLTCLGPTSEAVYLVLLSQDRNVGVSYEYSVPSQAAPVDEPDTYSWTYTPYEPCSASCGGGIQHRNVTCNSRTTLKQVEEGLCDATARPAESQKCALEACPPQWSEGPWSNCSMPCGSEGKQTRDVHCEQVNAEGVSEKVEDAVCLEHVGNKPATEQECNRGTVCPEWYVSKWTPCNKLCGEGEQSRKVICYRKEDGRITVLDDSECVTDKPEEKQTCMLRPCEGVDYIASSWSGCEECGSMVETRTVYCASKSGTVYDNKFCANRELPELKRECKSTPCEYQWFTSQWSKCSAVCGNGVQTRSVVCGVFDGQSLKRADDDYKCDAALRPENERECEGPAECPGQWFTGPWTDCSKACGGGFMSRKVLCIANGSVVAETNCKVDTIELSTESCNSHDCTDDEIIPVDVTSKPLEEDDYDDEEWCEDEDEEATESPDDVLMVTDDSTLVDGVDLESTQFTTESSLETDEMMLSDATGFETGATEVDTATDVSTIEGSGFDIDVRLGESVSPATGEGSGDDEEITTEAVDASSDASEATASSDSVSGGPTLESLSSIKETSATSTESSRIGASDTTAVSIEASASTEAATEGSSIASSTEGASSSSSADTTTESSSVSSISDTTVESSSPFSSSDSTDSSSTTESSSSTESSAASSDASTTETSSGTTAGSSAASSEAESTTAESSTESSTDLSTDDEIIEDFSTESSTPAAEGSTDASDITDSSDVTEATDASSSTVQGSSTESSDATTIMEETQSTGPTESTVTEETVSTQESSSTEAVSTVSSVSDASESSEASTESSTDVSDSSTDSSTDVESSTFDIWVREGGDADDESSTPYTLTSIISKEQKPRKCKPRPKTPLCAKSKFGCCPDGKTKAAGPFDEGCPVPETCKETKHGCCPDGVSPAKGPKNRGCPKSECAETLFGCCPDKFTPSEGNDFEGCPVETTTVAGCVLSKHGCCADGVTEAKGPNYKGCPGVKEPEEEKPAEEVTETPVEAGCAASTYGCCPDNVTEATGPNEEGCASCVKEPFGCCPDGKTPAHGWSREGCCLETPYGCCPDNINPARGPSLEGCGCEYSPYGCCPDNKTSARGHDNMGCGCQYAEFGCCPDKETEAEGPDFAGCPCHAFQFGCCPDGITAAKGPHNHGCHCSYSEFKCCSDGQTAAQGPNFEGCTCATSKYGCCPDGVNEAQGNKFEGCELVPESPQKACVLKKDMGTCHNYTVKYFFDVEYGGCGRFWYGGCDGNKNRFDTAEDCKNVCEMPDGKDRCQLPKITGPCTGYYPMWYYDTDRNTCAQFTYGGCLGNANRFETLEECKGTCVVDDAMPPCDQPMEAGPCNGTFARWYYEKARDACEPFLYGGCKGNKNNYPTESSCNYHCKKPGVHKQKDVCFLPAEIGECQNYTAHWYFDTKESRCRQFYYGGCGGNGNNFVDEQACVNRCVQGEAKAPEPAQPEQPTQREEFDSRYCFLDVDSGDRSCQQYERRYHYDRSSGICVDFTYTGCGGNQNNFERYDECESACGSVEDACTLRPFYGRCEENETRWYYDQRSQRCHTFTFSGCQGNANNFYTEQDCERQCRTAPAPPPEQEREQEPERPAQPTENVCDEPYEYGTGDHPDIVYVFNKERSLCEQNYYSGEGGNGNRFGSQEQCERQCGEYRGVDVCQDAKDAGPCEEAIPRFYYDTRTRACHPFNYSGCEGNGNRFATAEECESTCVDKHVANEVDPCESYNEECRQIHCPYGIARSYDPNNDCERCSCEEPCAAVRCPAGTECAVDLQSDYRDGATFVAICRPTSKEGECPRLANATVCQDACRTDADCRSDNKCCQAGCATVCVPPVEPPAEPVPSYPTGEAAAPGLETVPDEDLDIKSEEGGIATLRCYATGFPPPSIRWKKGEVVLNTNQGRFVLTSSGDLQIVQLHRTDSGTYVCIADNGVGEPVFREVKLQVNVPVSARQDLPYGTQFAPNSNITIGCKVDGYPRPTVNWYKDGRIVEPTNRIYIEDDHTLNVFGALPSDSGSYKCLARNEHSEAFEENTIRVEGVYIPAGCTDNPFLAKCALIVQARFCNHKYYARFCCKSCTLAGQLRH